MERRKVEFVLRNGNLEKKEEEEEEGKSLDLSAMAELSSGKKSKRERYRKIV